MYFALYNRFKNLIQRQQSNPAQVDRVKGILEYGVANAFPLKYAKAVQDSETAVAALDTLVKFTRGSGFSDPELEKKVINSRAQTFWEFHCEAVKSVETFRGVYINVKYSRTGVPADLYVMAFENCRLGVPDDSGLISRVVYNPFFGSGNEKAQETKEYDVYNPDPEIVKAQIARCKGKYPGQVFYWGETTALSRFYPRPNAATCIHWMRIEAGISVFHEENLDNGFFQSVILRMIGNPNDPSTHPDDQVWNESQQQMVSTKTTGQRFNIEMQKFSGSERVGNVMVQWGGNKDEWPDVIPFPTNANTEFFNTLSDRATDKIVLGFNVVAILANIQKGGTLGGDGNLVRVGVKLQQSRVGDDQKTLVMIYSKLLRSFREPYTQDFTILSYNPYPELDKVDEQVWETLSIPEKRLWIKENTPYKLLEAPTPAAPATALQAKAVLWTDYPEKAKQNAKTALKYRDGDCGTKMGWDRCQKIADGMPISFKETKRIYSWLNKNSWAKDRIPGEDCDAVQFLAWGGYEMFKWAGERIKQME